VPEKKLQHFFAGVWSIPNKTTVQGGKDEQMEEPILLVKQSQQDPSANRKPSGRLLAHDPGKGVFHIRYGSI
jgi:hypothetical protein